jgi:hypothetical protein
MTDKHIKVYRIISTFTLEQSMVGVKKFSQFEIDKITEFLETNCSDRYEFQFDGNVCNWSKEGYDYDIFFITEQDIRKIENWDKIIHEGLEGYTTIEDITEDVLYDILDTSVFGFYELEMKEIFYEYRVEYLTKDDILDKMLKYGKESLTENDKLFLDDKEMMSPLDDLEKTK